MLFLRRGTNAALNACFSMSLQKRPFSLVIARPRPHGPGADVLVSADFDEAGFRQIANSKHRTNGNFPAVMASDGRFAVLPNGLIYDPFRKRAGGGKSIAERSQQALILSEALFLAMDGIDLPELNRLLHGHAFDARRLRQAQALGSVALALGVTAFFMSLDA